MIGFLVDSFVVEGFSSMFYVELNLRYEKGLINCVHNPNKTMISSHLDALSKY